MTQWFSSKEFDRPSSQRRKKTTSSLSHSKLKITSPLVAEALLNKNSPSQVFIRVMRFYQVKELLNSVANIYNAEFCYKVFSRDALLGKEGKRDVPLFATFLLPSDRPQSRRPVGSISSSCYYGKEGRYFFLKLCSVFLFGVSARRRIRISRVRHFD
mgnify:CR=1 FL=1